MSDVEQPGAALIGVVLGNSYEVTRFIGRGGMGAVYEGRHMRLGQPVAIKIMSGDLASSHEALVRFRREAEVTSRIGHPHIVHVFDFGSARTGEPFLVMEYLEGEDLEHRIGRLGRMSVRNTVHIVKQTAAALAAAHAKGVVHRDLKPANVFLLDLESESDFVKIVDFGISKVKAASTKLTRSSVVMGTPDYMSPEQARGRIDEIDHRTDQWALAAMTYEMLAGRTPFAGEDVAAVLYQVTREEPRPLGRMVKGLPAALGEAVHRALSKRPSDRFPDITSFSRALEEAIADAAIEEEPAPRPRVSARKATVAYGSVDPVPVEPDTLQDTAPLASSTTTDKDPKRTTFSHATGEAKVPFHWKQLRARPRMTLAALAAVSATLVVWLAVRSRPSPSESARSPAGVRMTTATQAPTILPMAAPPPTFVGPPLPPPEELAKAKAQAAAYARANTRNTKPQLDPSDHLPNPFEDSPQVESTHRRPLPPPPADAPRQESKPAPPAPLPATPPAQVAPPRPKRQLIKEL